MLFCSNRSEDKEGGRTDWQKRRQKEGWGKIKRREQDMEIGFQKVERRKRGMTEEGRCKKRTSWVNKTCMSQSYCVHRCAFHLHSCSCSPFKRCPSLHTPCMRPTSSYTSLRDAFIILHKSPCVPDFRKSCINVSKDTFMYSHVCMVSSGITVSPLNAKPL